VHERWIFAGFEFLEERLSYTVGGG